MAVVTAQMKLARLKKGKSRPQREQRKPQKPKVKEYKIAKPKKVRRPGEKKKVNGTKLLKLPSFPDLREPKEPTPLQAFIQSCQDEVPYMEALHEFQENWCEHPRGQMELVTIATSLDVENVSYTRRCGACGSLKELRGRPPGWLERR